MTTAVKELLSYFERLTAKDQNEAVREILRRTANEGYPPLTDDELCAVADDLFLELDRRDDHNIHGPPKM